MKLILIVKRGTDETTVDLLQKAAKKFKVDVIAHDYRDPLPELNPTEKICCTASPLTQAPTIKKKNFIRHIAVYR